MRLIRVDRRSFVNALAIKDGRIHATGDIATVMAYRAAATRVLYLNGRTVIPGQSISVRAVE